MRMRGRRLLPIVLSLIVIIILCISYISNHLRESAARRDDGSERERDEYLVHLPPIASIDDNSNRSSDKVNANPGPLLNLSNFDYLLASDVCRRAERELLGKSLKYVYIHIYKIKFLTTPQLCS